MPKYFFKPEQLQGERVVLDGETAHHLQHVLRMDIGEQLNLCNGAEVDYIAEIETLTKTHVTCKILATFPALTEPCIKVTLYQGLPKGDKLELIIQKCVELGVTAIIPVITSRSVVRKSDVKKNARYQRIAESASCQSMRGIIPSVETAIHFSEAVMQVNSSTLVAYEEEKRRTLKKGLQQLPQTCVNIWVGPEGGFSEGEIYELASQGATTVTLGPRILRTETAAISMLAQIMCLSE